VNNKSATILSTSEVQLRLALALVILGFEERVDKQTRELLEREQAMYQLERQREVLLEQRKRDTDYLAASMRQLYPEISLTLSEEGRVEIPSEVQQQLKLLQQEQQLPSLPGLTGLSVREEVGDWERPAEQAGIPDILQETLPPVVVKGETWEETDIDPRAKTVLVYLLSQPPSSVLDWRITVQRALDLPDPPKMRSHAVYKAVQRAYQVLESMHDSILPHPSASLQEFYTQYVIEEERWGDLKDTMNEWGVA